MYRCQICHTQSAPGQRRARVVVESRTVTHPPVYDRVGVEVSPGGIGPQIVREVNAHPECVYTSQTVALPLAEIASIADGAA